MEAGWLHETLLPYHITTRYTNLLRRQNLKCRCIIFVTRPPADGHFEISPCGLLYSSVTVELPLKVKGN